MVSTIRPTTAADSSLWLDLIQATLGSEYPVKDIYDLEWIAGQLDPNGGQETWVAEAGGRIVGCVPVDNVQTGRHWGEYETLDLRYAAGQELDALIGKVLERHALILASVKDTNRSALAARLERLGFHESGRQLGERHFRRDP